MGIELEDFNSILNHFQIYGDFIKAKSFGSGHINDTFLIKYKQAGQKVYYILRRINDYVFKNPQQIIENTINITDHIRQKIIEQNETDLSRKVLTLIKTKDDKYFYIDKNSKTWCVILFIKDAFTVNSVDNEIQAFEAAKAYGKFQKYLADFDVNKCHITIPNFHNLNNRLEKFDNIFNEDICKRADQVQNEIAKTEKYRFINEMYLDLTVHDIPARITHNDTKINNIMLNKKTKKGLCVLDLDTVMPGIILNDFGDMVRTFVSPALEDDKDFSNVHVRLNVFEAMTKGYLSELKDILTNDEKSNLLIGAKIIVYEQAVRFLTDFIEGDIYYKIDYPDHNLNRTKNQFTLLESIENSSGEMQKIIEKYC